MASSLNNILNMGRDSLANARLGVDVTGHNIANAHTPGYSRQRVLLESKVPVQYGLHVLGTGAAVEGIGRAHDKFLEIQVRKETQSQGLSESLMKGLSRIETLFNPELQASIRDRADDFFNSLRELSNYPEEPSVRLHVVETGKALVQTVNTAHGNVATIQQDLTEEVQADLASINTKLSQVASLNQAIKEMAPGAPASANDLEDKRDGLIRELSALINIQAYKDENDNYSLRGPGGSLLVEGPSSATFVMEHQGGQGSYPRVLLRDHTGLSVRDVTEKVDDGKLGGMLVVRDQHAQYVRDKLNDFAFNLGNAFNAVHRKGYGLGEFTELSGRNFFTGHDGAGGGEPAAEISLSNLIAADPNSIGAGMTQGATGDNVVVNELVRLAYQPLFDDGHSTLSGLYDKMVGKIGVDSMHAQEDNSASKIVLAQLESQKESVSGVSLDEEAANLLKYQHLFTASSRVITTVDEMFKTVLDLKR